MRSLGVLHPRHIRNDHNGWVNMSKTIVTETNTGESFGSVGYRSYVLLTLTAIYLFNFLDRILISVLSRPIIEEFSLTNFQFGILTGIGFALFYTALGIPIARLSERVSRVKIIGVCVILWSLATALCGLAVGFWTLLFARLAVGVGEAGCTPPANSLIGDYYKPIDRPVALSIYATGVTIGIVLAQLSGGLILKAFSWREAFIFIGLPGVLIGLIMLFTVKEPPRGYSDPPGTIQMERVGLVEALKNLARNKAFWIISIAMSFVTFGGYGLTMFQSLFLQYTYGMSPGDAAIYYMAPFAFMGAIGTIIGGVLIKRFIQKSISATLWLPALSCFILTPILFFAFLTVNIKQAYIAFMIAGLFKYFYIGASYFAVQSIVKTRMRAMAIAILLFAINLLGYGGGPPFVGAIADMITSNNIQSLGMTDSLGFDCNPRDTSLADTMRTSCVSVKAYGMKWALIVSSAMYMVGGLIYLLAIPAYKNAIK